MDLGKKKGKVKNPIILECWHKLIILSFGRCEQENLELGVM